MVCTLLAYVHVTIRLIAPVKLLAPTACRDIMNTSTDIPAWLAARDNGGYTVHAVPAPSSTHDEPTMSRYASTSSHMDVVLGGTVLLLCMVVMYYALPSPVLVVGSSTDVIHSWALPVAGVKVCSLQK